jgi:hypothetical protein
MDKRKKNSPLMDHGSNDGRSLNPRAVQSRPAVRVECPHEGDVIDGPSYTFHIAAMPGAEGVEVSIDQGEWLPCREALGIWWYDWTGFAPGAHELTARTRSGDGISAASNLRRFTVG